MQEFFLDIIPPTTTAQEKKASCVHGRVMFYEPAKVKQAKKVLIDALLPFRPKEPIEDKPIFLCCQWIFPTPKGRKSGQWKTTRPDTDNLQKMLKDVMTQTGYWKDDALVVSELVSKKWGKHPGIMIRIEELGETDEG